MSGSLSAQSLLPDSTVSGITYRQLQEWAAFRLQSDERLRYCAIENARRESIIQAQDTHITLLQGVIDTHGAMVAELEKDNAAQRQRAIVAENRADRLRPWATVGKGAAVAVGVGLILILVK